MKRLVIGAAFLLILAVTATSLIVLRQREEKARVLGEAHVAQLLGGTGHWLEAQPSGRPRFHSARSMILDEDFSDGMFAVAVEPDQGPVQLQLHLADGDRSSPTTFGPSVILVVYQTAASSMDEAMPVYRDKVRAIFAAHAPTVKDRLALDFGFGGEPAGGHLTTDSLIWFRQ